MSSCGLGVALLGAGADRLLHKPELPFLGEVSVFLESFLSLCGRVLFLGNNASPFVHHQFRTG